MVDRAKDMIITGGENVYSVEVEAVLSKHPGVDEVAVFGVPDERWGEAVHAVVVGRATRRRCVEHCRAALAGFKVPRVDRACATSRSPSRAPGSCSSTSFARRTGRAATVWWAEAAGDERRVDRVPDRPQLLQLLVAEPVQEQLPDPGEMGLVGGPERAEALRGERGVHDPPSFSSRVR